MARIAIRSDGNGGAVVSGTPPDDNGFFEFAVGKVLSGKITEISWEPITRAENAETEFLFLRRNKEN